MKNWRMYENLALITQVGITLALYIVGAIMLGGWLDTRFGTSPLFLLVLLLVGIVAAFYNVFKMLMHIGTKEGREDQWKK